MISFIQADSRQCECRQMIVRLADHFRVGQPGELKKAAEVFERALIAHARQEGFSRSAPKRQSGRIAQ